MKCDPFPSRCDHSGYSHGNFNFPEYARANGKRKKVFEQHRPPHPAHRRGCWFASAAAKASNLPACTVREYRSLIELPGPFPPLLSMSHPFKFESMAKVLPVCRFGDKPSSPSAE